MTDPQRLITSTVTEQSSQGGLGRERWKWGRGGERREGCLARALVDVIATTAGLDTVALTDGLHK